VPGGDDDDSTGGNDAGGVGDSASGTGSQVGDPCEVSEDQSSVCLAPDLVCAEGGVRCTPGQGGCACEFLELVTGNDSAGGAVDCSDVAAGIQVLPRASPSHTGAQATTMGRTSTARVCPQLAQPRLPADRPQCAHSATWWRCWRRSALSSPKSPRRIICGPTTAPARYPAAPRVARDPALSHARNGK
jgi:hypothetical protein